MNLILAKLWPYLAALAVGLGGGWYLGSAHWKSQYETLSAEDWKSRAQGEALAKETLAKQLVQAQATSQNNADVMLRLANENAQTVQDRDSSLARVRRLEQLLAAAAARSSARPTVPTAQGGQTAPGTSGDPSIDRIGELLIRARDEARRNADRLNALIAEITPQLESPP